MSNPVETSSITLAERPYEPVDEIGIQERASSFTKRSIKKDSKLFALNLVFRSRMPKPYFPVPGSVPRPRACYSEVIRTDTDRCEPSFSSKR